MIKTYLGAALIAATAFGGASAQDRAGWPESFTVATASQGGTFFVYGSGFANLIADQLKLSGAGEVTGGPMQNMALVHTGEAAFGMTTMGPANESINGTNPIAPGVKLDNACAMFPMYKTPFAVSALASSGIKSVSDIPKGARIGFGPAGSSSDTYFPAMMTELGVDYDRRNGSWNDLGSQLQDGLLDVVAFAVGVPTPAVSQLEVQTEMNFIEFTADEQAKILAKFPVADFTIPAATYSTLNNDLRSVSMWNFGIANCDLAESFVYEATNVIMSDNARMMGIHKAAKETVFENWDKNKVLMWHPGAARWFNENGATIPANEIHGG
ncbi:MAG: TAXI family TRAP transporter solute-binding subunit [Proteobacteria bacterium]|nr:TAXI family TRAP transporter solute-binding subunit [Pseudomonadota bacterium]